MLKKYGLNTFLLGVVIVLLVLVLINTSSNYVVAQGDVEAIALSGQFGGEQGEQGFLVEGGIYLGFARGGRAGLFHRRGAVRRRRAEGLATTQ